MNRELRQLLVDAGCREVAGPNGAFSVLMVGNRGAVPPPAGLPPESARRGFNLIVVDRGGRPTHFVRCAGPEDASLAREGRILEALAGQPAMARIIPPVRCVVSERIRLLATGYIPGRSYASMLRSRDPDVWSSEASEILQVSEVVTRCAEAILPDLVTEGGTVRVADEVVPKLEVLAGAGTPAPYLDALRGALDAVPPMPRRLQHGDLWPANVIRHDDAWWLIDFAEFAQAQVPMYDVFLLLHQTWMMRNTTAEREAWVQASRRVVAESAARFGLSRDQVAAGMVYYLIHLSAYRLRHGVPYAHRGHFLRHLLQLAERLLAGVNLGALPFPWEHPHLHLGV